MPEPVVEEVVVTRVTKREITLEEQDQIRILEQYGKVFWQLKLFKKDKDQEENKYTLNQLEGMRPDQQRDAIRLLLNNFKWINEGQPHNDRS